MTDQEFITVSEPAKASFTITADNRLIWHDPMPVADHSVILAATDVVANHYGLVRRELLEAAEAKLTKAVEERDEYKSAAEICGKAARAMLAELEEKK